MSTPANDSQTQTCNLQSPHICNLTDSQGTTLFEIMSTISCTRYNFIKSFDVPQPLLVWHQHIYIATPAKLMQGQEICLTHNVKFLKITYLTWHGDLDLWAMTLTFDHDLDIIHVHHHAKFGNPKSNGFWDMNFCLVTFGLVWILVKSQTDRQTDIQKAMHMSPPCLCTGVLKNWHFSMSKSYFWCPSLQ